MYLLRFINLIEKTYSVINASKVVSFSSVFQNFSKRNISNKFSLKPKIDKDIVLYKFEKPRYFLYLNIFSGSQCILWAYLGVFLFTSIQTAESTEKKKRFWESVLSNRKFSYALSFVAVAFGLTIYIATIFYTTRSVRKIILLKGGRNLTILTYKLPGFENVFKVPISKISAAEHRTDAKKYIPIRMKDRSFFYILDLKGQFLEPELFDFTAGIKRNI